MQIRLRRAIGSGFNRFTQCPTVTPTTTRNPRLTPELFQRVFGRFFYTEVRPRNHASSHDSAQGPVGDATSAVRSGSDMPCIVRTIPRPPSAEVELTRRTPHSIFRPGCRRGQNKGEPSFTILVFSSTHLIHVGRSVHPSRVSQYLGRSG